MNTITFFVPGNPQALKRHRTFHAKGRAIQYDPSQGDKADFLAKCMEHRPPQPWDEPIMVSLSFYFSRPKSHYNAKGKLKATAKLYHVSKPDVDNLTKLVMDAMNGWFFRDDSQAFEIHAFKSYSEMPGVKVEIKRIPGDNQVPGKA